MRKRTAAGKTPSTCFNVGNQPLWQWRYIRYVDLNAIDELYDLHADPFEMKSTIGETDTQPVFNLIKLSWTVFARNKVKRDRQEQQSFVEGALRWTGFKHRRVTFGKSGRGVI